MTEPAGARRPSPRALVRHELARSDRFRTVNDIYLALAGGTHRASLSTVYRTLTTLADTGIAETITLPSAGTAYRLRLPGTAGPYLVCVSCGTAAPAPASDLTPWFRVVATRQGFTDVATRVELWGRCAGCRRSLNENDSEY